MTTTDWAIVFVVGIVLVVLSPYIIFNVARLWRYGTMSGEFLFLRDHAEEITWDANGKGSRSKTADDE